MVKVNCISVYKFYMLVCCCIQYTLPGEWIIWMFWYFNKVTNQIPWEMRVVSINMLMQTNYVFINFILLRNLNFSPCIPTEIKFLITILGRMNCGNGNAVEHTIQVIFILHVRQSIAWFPKIILQVQNVIWSKRRNTKLMYYNQSVCYNLKILRAILKLLLFHVLRLKLKKSIRWALQSAIGLYQSSYHNCKMHFDDYKIQLKGRFYNIFITTQNIKVQI